MTLTPTLDLVEGTAQLITNAAMGFTYPAETAPDGQVGVYLVKIPTSPDDVLVLSPFPLSADPTRPENETGLQLYLRTAGPRVRDHWAKRDALDGLLLGLFPIDLPTGLKVTTLTWTSGTLPALDDNQRWVSIANYTARHYRPSAHRN